MLLPIFAGLVRCPPPVFWGKYSGIRSANTRTFSCAFIGYRRALRKPVGMFFRQIHSLRRFRRLLAATVVVKGCCVKSTAGARGLDSLRHSRQSSGIGITESHAFSVVPYGRSVRTRSIESAGRDAITSRQSPWINVFVTVKNPQIKSSGSMYRLPEQKRARAMAMISAIARSIFLSGRSLVGMW